jgi:peptidoglycan hydrolase CwlO-like protein
MSDKARRVVGMLAVVGCLAVLSGCDWWPPVLQQRIGQQETQIQNLGKEKTALQSKVAELTKAVDDCKAQSAQVAKAQADLQAQVDQLKAALGAAEAKLLKKGKPGKNKK